MKRTAVKEWIQQNYGITSDFPWEKYPTYEVFRHSNQKWFAVMMTVPKQKLGIAGS